LKNSQDDSRANFIALLVQLLRVELRLHLKGNGMTRRTLPPDCISVLGYSLRRVTSPALERIKYRPISVEVGSYYKPMMKKESVSRGSVI
jgi:hypothetical protein